MLVPLPIIVKELFQEYYELPHGELIEKHTEIIYLYKIHNKEHYHHGKHLCISRKSIKHFIESRKDQLLKNHSSQITREVIEYVFSEIITTVTDYYSYEHEKPNRYLFTRKSVHTRIPAIRIITEEINSELHIISIHITKNKKPIHRE